MVEEVLVRLLEHLILGRFLPRYPVSCVQLVSTSFLRSKILYHVPIGDHAYLVAESVTQNQHDAQGDPNQAVSQRMSDGQSAPQKQAATHESQDEYGPGQVDLTILAGQRFRDRVRQINQQGRDPDYDEAYDHPDSG